jgi:hypothetical protein
MTTLALAVREPVASASEEKPPNTTVCGAPMPGAGQHRDDGLGDHRHVDRDPVAGLDAELGQRVGGLADLVLELGVGDRRGCRPGSPTQWSATWSPGRPRRAGRRSCTPR